MKLLHKLSLFCLGAVGSLTALALPSTARAQTTVCTYTEQNGTARNCTGVHIVAGGGGAGASASDGTNGATAPTSSSQVGGRTAAGNLTPACVDTAGALCSPRAGTANRVITKTSVAAATSTTICPAQAVPVTVEVQVSVANVGLGFSNQTLTGAVLGVTATDPDLVMPTANTLYVFPVAPTNAISAYAAATFIATCIQTLRQ